MRKSVRNVQNIRKHRKTPVFLKIFITNISEITDIYIYITNAWRCKKCCTWSLRQEVATVLGRVGREGIGGDGTCLDIGGATDCYSTVLVCCTGYRDKENKDSKEKVD